MISYDFYVVIYDWWSGQVCDSVSDVRCFFFFLKEGNAVD